MSAEIAYPPRIDRPLTAPTESGGRIVVDLDAVAENWRIIQHRVGRDCIVAAAVKADGYGLGMAPIASALARAGCRWFFVALPAEGVALAAALLRDFPDSRIVVLSGPLPGSSEPIAAPLIPVLNTLDQIREWRDLAPGRPAMLHLDTGMARLGLPEADLAPLLSEAGLFSSLTLVGVISHLACADEPHHPMNEFQRSAFDRVMALFPNMPHSLAASSGTFLGPAFHYDMVRIGAALYGVNPIPGRANPMRQVVTIQARIIQVRDLLPGETVGYGAIWRASRHTRVATLALGYADGLLRAAGNRAVCRIGAAEAPVIGRISMDLMTIDITELPDLVPGDFVDIVGPHYDLDDLARDGGTLAYELLTRLGSRLPRHYVMRAS